MINIRYDNCMMKIGIRKISLPHTHTHNKKRIPEKVVAAMTVKTEYYLETTNLTRGT